MAGADKGSRFQNVDSMPEDARQDPDFLKAMAQLEDQQASRGGWLFARGAFDKSDLLHLKEEEDRRRHVEEDMEERERSAFLAARQKLEEEEQKKTIDLAAAAARKAAALKKDQDAAKKRRVIPIVKVKPANGGVIAGTGPPENIQQPVKRSRIESEDNSKDAVRHDSHKLPSAEQQQQVEGIGKQAANSNPDDPGNHNGNNNSNNKEESSEDGGGLGDLLGGYASSSENEDNS